MDVNEIIDNVEDFASKVEEETYNHIAGLKDELELKNIYDEYGFIFTEENIKLVRGYLKDSEDVDKKRYRYLLMFLINEHLSLKTISLIEEMETYRTKATVKIDDKEVAYNQLGILIVKEDSKERRDYLYSLANKIREHLVKLRQKILKKQYKIAEELGYKNYLEMYQELKDIELKEFAEQLKEFLVKTELAYKNLMKENMKKIDLELENVKQYDYGHYINAKEFDKFFKKEDLINVLKEFLKNLGFDIEKSKNIKYDLEEREKKNPRAYCFSIKIPDDIRFITKPSGGYNDYHSLLHEAGHAIHYGNTNASLDIVFKYLGDHSTSETYAMLLNNLLRNKEWLKLNIKISDEDIKKFLDRVNFGEVYMIRRYIAKLIYEIKLHSNDLRKIDNNFNDINEKYKDFKECYRDILSRATKVNYDSIFYLLDLDSGFYSADYLRAWIFEAQLRNKLKENFGSKWFENKKSGELLKELFEFGNENSVYEIAKHIGYDGLDLNYLLNEYLEFLNKV